MSDLDFALFLFFYGFSAFCILCVLALQSQNPRRILPLIVLAVMAIGLSVVLGQSLVERDSFLSSSWNRLIGLVRPAVVAAALGISTALPLAALMSVRAFGSWFAGASGMLGTIFLAAIITGKEFISPYLPMPDSSFSTGSVMRVVPSDFVLEEYLDTSVIPVRISVSESGRVYVSGHSGIAAQQGVIVELVETNDGVQERRVATMLNRPYGLVARDDALFVSRSGQFVRWTEGRAEQFSTGAVTMLRDLDGDGVMDYYDDIVTDLPGAKGPDYLHQNNGIAFSEDGTLYLTTANHSDGYPVPDERAGAILRAAAPSYESVDVFASGLRNPFGIVFDVDGRLLVTDNDAQSGLLGGNLGDKLLEVKEGDFFGHPYAFDDAAEVTPPLLRSDYALGGLTLAQSQMLPAIYRDSVFVVVYGEGRIMRVVTDVESNVSLQPFATVPGAVDIAAAPNGDFYVAVYPDRVMRIRYVGVDK